MLRSPLSKMLGLNEESKLIASSPRPERQPMLTEGNVISASSQQINERRGPRPVSPLIHPHMANGSPFSSSFDEDVDEHLDVEEKSKPNLLEKKLPSFATPTHSSAMRNVTPETAVETGKRPKKGATSASPVYLGEVFETMTPSMKQINRKLPQSRNPSPENHDKNQSPPRRAAQEHDNIPRYMKPTKAKELKVSDAPIARVTPDQQIKRQHQIDHLPRYMKTTQVLYGHELLDAEDFHIPPPRVIHRIDPKSSQSASSSISSLHHSGDEDEGDFQKYAMSAKFTEIIPRYMQPTKAAGFSLEETSKLEPAAPLADVLVATNTTSGKQAENFIPAPIRKLLAEEERAASLKKQKPPEYDPEGASPIRSQPSTEEEVSLPINEVQARTSPEKEETPRYMKPIGKTVQKSVTETTDKAKQKKLAKKAAASRTISSTDGEPPRYMQPTSAVVLKLMPETTEGAKPLPVNISLSSEELPHFMKPTSAAAQKVTPEKIEGITTSAHQSSPSTPREIFVDKPETKAEGRKAKSPLHTGAKPSRLAAAASSGTHSNKFAKKKASNDQRSSLSHEQEELPHYMRPTTAELHKFDTEPGAENVSTIIPEAKVIVHSKGKERPTKHKHKTKHKEKKKREVKVITNPESPKFHELHKKSRVKSSEEMDLEIIEEYTKKNPFRANPILIDDLEKFFQEAAPKVEPREVTKPEPFSFMSDKRASTREDHHHRRDNDASHKVEPMLNKHELEDLEECKKQFRALPMPKFSSAPPIKYNRVMSQRTKQNAQGSIEINHAEDDEQEKGAHLSNVTIPVPFRLRVDERLEQRRAFDAKVKQKAELQKSATQPEDEVKQKPKLVIPANQPFQLRSLQRHEARKRETEENRIKQEMEEQKLRNFHARSLPKSIKKEISVPITSKFMEIQRAHFSKGKKDPNIQNFRARALPKYFNDHITVPTTAKVTELFHGRNKDAKKDNVAPKFRARALPKSTNTEVSVPTTTKVSEHQQSRYKDAGKSTFSNMFRARALPKSTNCQVSVPTTNKVHSKNRDYLNVMTGIAKPPKAPTVSPGKSAPPVVRENQKQKRMQQRQAQQSHLLSETASAMKSSLFSKMHISSPAKINSSKGKSSIASPFGSGVHNSVPQNNKEMKNSASATSSVSDDEIVFFDSANDAPPSEEKQLSLSADVDFMLDDLLGDHTYNSSVDNVDQCLEELLGDVIQNNEDDGLKELQDELGSEGLEAALVAFSMDEEESREDHDDEDDQVAFVATDTTPAFLPDNEKAHLATPADTINETLENERLISEAVDTPLVSFSKDEHTIDVTVENSLEQEEMHASAAAPHFEIGVNGTDAAETVSPASFFDPVDMKENVTSMTSEDATDRKHSFTSDGATSEANDGPAPLLAFMSAVTTSQLGVEPSQETTIEATQDSRETVHFEEQGAAVGGEADGNIFANDGPAPLANFLNAAASPESATEADDVGVATGNGQIDIQENDGSTGLNFIPASTEAQYKSAAEIKGPAISIDFFASKTKANEPTDGSRMLCETKEFSNDMKKVNAVNPGGNPPPSNDFVPTVAIVPESLKDQGAASNEEEGNLSLSDGPAPLVDFLSATVSSRSATEANATVAQENRGENRGTDIQENDEAADFNLKSAPTEAQYESAAEITGPAPLIDFFSPETNVNDLTDGSLVIRADMKEANPITPGRKPSPSTDFVPTVAIVPESPRDQVAAGNEAEGNIYLSDGPAPLVDFLSTAASCQSATEQNVGLTEENGGIGIQKNSGATDFNFNPPPTEAQYKSAAGITGPAPLIDFFCSEANDPSDGSRIHRKTNESSVDMKEVNAVTPEGKPSPSNDFVPTVAIVPESTIGGTRGFNSETKKEKEDTSTISQGTSLAFNLLAKPINFGKLLQAQAKKK